MSSARTLTKHALTFAVLAISMLTSSIVPEGWMPAKASEGTFTVRICSQGLTEAERIHVEALAQAQVDHAMHGVDRHSDDDRQSVGDPCPYSVVANALAVPPVSPRMAEPIESIEADLPLLASNVGIGMGLAAPPPPSTGPPIIS